MPNQSAFYKAHESELQTLLRRYESELLEEVAPFWSARVLDKEHGGYHNHFDRMGRPLPGDKPGWFVGRNLYTFSALCNELGPKQEWLEIARAGRAYMDTAFHAGDGRYQQMMRADGTVARGFSSIFTDHFIAKGLYEYIRADHLEADTESIALAKQITSRLMTDVADPAIHRMEGIPEGMQKHALNFMTLIVALESRKLFENVYKDILTSCVHKSLYVFANDAIQAPFEYVSLDGTPILRGEGRLVDAGHTMESLWFSMHAGEALGKPEYIRRAAEVLDWVLARAYDLENGGFFQQVDIEYPKPETPFLATQYADVSAAWDDKIWWVQAEGLYALAASALYREDERHFGYFLRMVDFTENALRDHDYGEWYSILHRDGSVKDSRKGFELKGAYHVPRCLMQLVLLLRRYLAGSLPAVAAQDKNPFAAG